MKGAHPEPHGTEPQSQPTWPLAFAVPVSERHADPSRVSHTPRERGAAPGAPRNGDPQMDPQPSERNVRRRADRSRLFAASLYFAGNLIRLAAALLGHGH